MPALESEVKKYEAILKLINEIVDSKTKLELLEAELCWSRVIALERDVREATQNLEKAKEQSVQLVERMRSVNENLAVARAELQKYTDEIAETDKVKKAKAAEVNDHKRIVEQEKRKFRDIEVSIVCFVESLTAFERLRARHLSLMVTMLTLHEVSYCRLLLYIC